MSINFSLVPDSPDAKRPKAESLRALFGMIRGVQGTFPNYRYQGAEVDIESDLARISFHMHSSQSKEERDVCFALMDDLARRLGWTRT